MRGTAKLSVTMANTVATFEGPPGFVEAQISKYIAGISSSDSHAHSDGQVSSSESGMHSREKELLLAKRPAGHSETVAVLAFALMQAGVSEFTEKDMREAYIRAGVRPPKVVGQAIRDAKNVFDYLDRAGKR